MFKNLLKSELLKFIWACFCLILIFCSIAIVVWKGNGIEGWIVILVLSLRELDSYLKK